MNVLNCISNASELKYMHAHACSRAHTHRFDTKLGKEQIKKYLIV